MFIPLLNKNNSGNMKDLEDFFGRLACTCFKPKNYKKKPRQYSSLEQWNCFHGGWTEIAKLKNIWVVIILLATLELNGYFHYKTITPQSLLSEAIS